MSVKIQFTTSDDFRFTYDDEAMTVTIMEVYEAFSEEDGRWGEFCDHVEIHKVASDAEAVSIASNMLMSMTDSGA